MKILSIEHSKFANWTDFAVYLAAVSVLPWAFFHLAPPSVREGMEEIEAGRAPNVAAPAIARRYWKLADDATLRDVVLVVRADEAHHRDVNHGLADQLSGHPVDLTPLAPYPEHADSDR